MTEPNVTVIMTVDEYIKVKALERRDTPRPIKEYHYTTESLKGLKQDVCPVCGAVVIKVDNFCSKCGQRLDHENIEL